MNRRSRVSKGQSKYGCFTCKARKVKCDETKPACLRCQRAHRVCEGYPERAHESPSSVGSPAIRPLDQHVQPPLPLGHEGATSPHTAPGSPIVPTDLGFTDEERQYIKLALRIVFRPQVDDFQYAYEPLKDCLFQFDYLCPSTKAAAAVVGAVTEQIIHPALTQTRSKSSRAHIAYMRAIRLLRQDLTHPQSHRSSLLLSTILLMSVELMLSRRQNALKHLCGAGQVLTATATTVLPSDSPRRRDIELAHRAVDILWMSYSNCTQRSIISPVPHNVPQDISELSQSIELFDKHVLETVHAGFCFITTAALAICRNEPLDDLQVEQKQHLVDISQCLNEITGLLDRHKEANEAHVYRLRCMCLSIFIEVSTLFSESETAWDEYAYHFEEIVLAAERVLEARSNGRSRLPPSMPVFSLQLGIVQPLYLVAMKYRHVSWRRRAISQLREAGQDGPWKGSLLATVAEWCAQVEEAEQRVLYPPTTTFEFSEPSYPSTSHDPASVPEGHRIAVCRFVEDATPPYVDNEYFLAGDASPSLGVKLLRRRRPVGAIPARVLSPAGVDDVIESEHLTLTRLDEGDWEQWTASIPL